MISLVQPRVLSWEGLDVPADFPYLAAIFQGPPTHDHDAFSLRHPRMEREKRAKIFAPFDALDGHSAAIHGKERRFQERRVLSEEELRFLNAKLNRLFELCPNSKAARRRQLVLRVWHFRANDLPATDWRAGQGDYVEQIGVLQYINLTEQYLLLGGVRIWFSDIDSIRQMRSSRTEQHGLPSG